MERLDEYLCHLIGKIEAKQSECDRQCDRYRELLKPWQKKENILAEASKNVQAKPLKDTSQAEDIFSKEISEVEDVLKKASKTRGKFLKNLRVISVHEKHKTVTGASAEGVLDSMNTNNNSSTPEDVGRRMTQSSSTARASSTQQCSSSKYVPVHKTAPFQTFGATKRVKPGRTRSQMLREAAASKLSAKAPDQRRVGHRKTRPSQTVRDAQRYSAPTSSYCDASHGDSPELISGLAQKREDASTSAVFPLGAFPQELSAALPTLHEPELPASSVAPQPRHEAVVEAMQPLHLAGDCSQFEETREEFLDPVKHGSTFKLPASYRKTESLNKKLRSQARQASLLEASEDISVQRDALRRLNNADTLQSLSNISCDSEVKSLTQRYKALKSEFDMLCEGPVNDDSHWEEVLSCWLRVHRLLNEFSSLEENYSEFVQVTNSFENDLDYKSIVEVKSKLRESCIREVGSSKIAYHNKAQLRRFWSLMFRVEQLKIELEICKFASRVFRPLLHRSTDSQDFRQTRGVYRGLQSLLCSSGKSFPTLIQEVDSPSSESTDENEF